MKELTLANVAPVGPRDHTGTEQLDAKDFDTDLITDN